MFSNVFLVYAWSIAGLWLVAFVWTIYCVKKQKPLGLDKNPGSRRGAPFVSIIVPARNEADRVLEKSIRSMLAQTYKNYELIVLNDRSTDNTKEILENLKFCLPQSVFRIIDGVEPTKDWLGKPHALEQAFRAAKGDWILATDADIIFAPEALQTVARYAEENRFDALTLIPKQIFGSFWEKFFMPVFGWFCIIAMPPHRVNNPNRRESMGVGNFFMFRRACLEKIGGFASVRHEIAEDLRLAEILKKQKFNLRIDYAPALITTRMYTSFREIWEGFTKNLFSGMKFSVTKTVLGTLSIFLFGVLPAFFALIFLAFDNFSFFAPFFLAYLLQASIFVFLHREWQGNALYALLAPCGLLMFLLILLNSTIKILSGKGVTWKSRPIYKQSGVRPTPD
ncbi:MAG TPA: glycosyltransferase family 2 protein [Pyrinomonadaceae bacterium]|jgi:chlorobactene glucosyltransferase